MARYLSEEWFRQLGAAEPDGQAEAPVPAGRALVLQHVVTGAPEGDVCYHVRVVGGTATVAQGRARTPDVTFSEDYATAAAVARGQLSAPAALMAGRIRVRGDLATLMAHQDTLLAGADPVPPAVRSTTTY